MSKYDLSIPNKATKWDLETLLDIAGSEGKYQAQLTAYAIFLSSFVCYIVYTSSFIYYQPDFHCFSDEAKTITRSCSESEALKNSLGYICSFTRESMIKKYKLYGDRAKYYVRTHTGINFYFSVFGLIILLICNQFGRRFGYIIPLILIASGAFIALITEGLFITALVLGQLSSAYEIYFAVSILHLGESLGGTLRSRFTSISFLIFSLGVIFFYALNRFLVGYYHIYWMLFGFSVIGIPLYFLCVKESPFYYFSAQRFDKLENLLLSISRINHNDSDHACATRLIKIGVKNLENQKLFADNAVTTENKDFSERQLPSNSRLFLYMVALSINFATMNFFYIILANITQQIPGADIYTTGILLTLVETITYAVMSRFADKCPRKRVNVSTALTFTIGGLLLAGNSFFIRRFPDLAFVEQIICMLIKCALCVNFSLIGTYLIEVLPSNRRGFTFAAAFFCGRIFSTLTGYIEKYAGQKGVNPMACAIPFGLLGLGFALTLPETLGSALFN